MVGIVTDVRIEITQIANRFNYVDVDCSEDRIDRLLARGFVEHAARLKVPIVIGRPNVVDATAKRLQRLLRRVLVHEAQTVRGHILDGAVVHIEYLVINERRNHPS